MLILHLGKVPVIDATGLVALENAIDGVAQARRDVILAGPLPQPRQIFDKAKLEERYPGFSSPRTWTPPSRSPSVCWPIARHRRRIAPPTFLR